MSRSFRHTAIVALTQSGYKSSEKKDKRIWHQKTRSQYRSILECIKDYESALDIKSFPHKNDVEKYTWLKDGKTRVTTRNDLSLYWTKDGHIKK